MTKPTEKQDPKPSTAQPETLGARKTPPDRSKETKLARATAALSGAASAYFDEGDTETALFLRRVCEDIKAKVSAKGAEVKPS